MTTVYVSHRIAGRTEDEIHNDEVCGAAWARSKGYEVLLPRKIPVFTHDGPCPPGMKGSQSDEHAHACYMRGDIIGMLIHCDVILLMPGWENSVGARAEFNAAVACGLAVKIYGRDD